MIRISNLSMDLDFSQESLKNKVIKKLNVKETDIISFNLSKKSVDARKKKDIRFVCSVDVELKKKVAYRKSNDIVEIAKEEYKIPFISNNKKVEMKNPPVIVGSGPSGLFCALVLARQGLNPIIIEQGKSVSQRKVDVENFWKNGDLNPFSNVQFGEGGAGTFSDGKLTTNVNNNKISFILEEFYKAGAPEEILYLNKPHIGTDFLVKIVKNVREEIIKLGGKIYFQLKLNDIFVENNSIKEIEVIRIGEEKSHQDLGVTNENPKKKIACDKLVLAIGHSSRETFEMLYNSGVNINSKPFSVGFRIEHLQKEINKSQYGEFAEHKALLGAEYKLSCKTSLGKGVYTFCMCPGGQVVASSSEENSVVTNGMSYFDRSGVNANSGILVSVNPSDFADKGPLAGVAFQRELERKAFKLGGNSYHAPVQLVGDYLKNIKSQEKGSVEPTYKPGVTWTNLNDLLPENLNNSIKEGIELMNRKINGFSSYDGVLTGIETRSSSPVKIERGEDGFTNIKGLIPCGEGCGLAGGIISASIDGLKCAEIIMQN